MTPEEVRQDLGQLLMVGLHQGQHGTLTDDHGLEGVIEWWHEYDFNASVVLIKAHGRTFRLLLEDLSESEAEWEARTRRANL
jgi:hypothetical protein